MEGSRCSWDLGMIGKGRCWSYQDFQLPTFQEVIQDRLVGAYIGCVRI